MSLQSKSSPRKTRSSSKQAPSTKEEQIDNGDEKDSTDAEQGSDSAVGSLTDDLTKSRTGLGSTDHALLKRKQRWLRTSTPSVPEGSRNLGPAIEATLVFAQESAGTAVCISPDGFLLTCHHCITEDSGTVQESISHWLLFASGCVVEARCVAWDEKRDLALLRVVATQSQELSLATSSASSQSAVFPFILPAEARPKMNAPLGCIGQPGSEDLEASLPGLKTNYDTLYVSVGAFRGYSKGQDIHDNSEIGALKHDCWTYWGHSGAPLVGRATGKLIGLHSSWDDQTGMRRGVALEAILAFLRKHDALLNIQS